MPMPTDAQPAATPAPSASTSATPNTSQQATPDAGPTSLPRLDADYLDNPAPAYPAESRRLGEQGRVLLRVLVNADGSVERVTLRKTSGHERLDDAAQQAVQQWRFVAAQRGDQAISAWVVIPISFSLEG